MEYILESLNMPAKFGYGDFYDWKSHKAMLQKTLDDWC